MPQTRCNPTTGTIGQRSSSATELPGLRSGGPSSQYHYQIRDLHRNVTVRGRAVKNLPQDSRAPGTPDAMAGVRVAFPGGVRIAPHGPLDRPDAGAGCQDHHDPAASPARRHAARGRRQAEPRATAPDPGMDLPSPAPGPDAELKDELPPPFLRAGARPAASRPRPGIPRVIPIEPVPGPGEAPTGAAAQVIELRPRLDRAGPRPSARPDAPPAQRARWPRTSPT